MRARFARVLASAVFPERPAPFSPPDSTALHREPHASPTDSLPTAVGRSSLAQFWRAIRARQRAPTTVSRHLAVEYRLTDITHAAARPVAWGSFTGRT
ncbi:hypothetical protein [Haloarcula sp. K1]|uniref:hypothetical protein n=1 Tax=Haloarcula sp. K1 TaxID=1622207 RepID=UPI000B0E5F34|nr:hypothetical protein [Haloarcula sp. K1]